MDWLQADSLGTEEHAQANNHGTWYDVQLIAFANFAGRPQIALQNAQEARTKRLAAQIDSAGMQPHEMTRTKSLFYHTFNLTALFSLARAAEANGVDLWSYNTPGRRGSDLRRALDYIAPYANPAVKWPREEILEYDNMDMFPVLMEGTRVWQTDKYLKQVAYLPASEVKSDRLRIKYPFVSVPPVGIGRHRPPVPSPRPLSEAPRAVFAADGRLRVGSLLLYAPR